jgi:branched-chain amino acid transport system substrate-binding protein
MSSNRLRRILTPAVVVTLGMGLAFTGLAGSASASTTPKASVPGVTANSITIGGTEPLTGIASPGYDEVSQAANAVFKWVDSHPAMVAKLHGRKITYKIVDDCYATPGFGCKGQSNELKATDELVNKPVFATVGSLGTPTQAPMRSVLAADGVPQLMVNSPSIDFNCGVPYKKNTTPYSQYEGCGAVKGKTTSAVYPDTFGWQTSYPAESMILAKYIKANFGSDKVCFLGQSDDFGHDGEIGLTYGGIHFASGAGSVAYYNVATLALSSNAVAYMSTFVNKFISDGCTLVYLDTIPGATAATLGAAYSKSYFPQWVISSVGSDPQTVGGLLGAGAGLEAGAISFSPLPATNDPNTAWSNFDHMVLEADPQSKYWGHVTGSTVLNGNEAIGIAEGVTFVEALADAGKTFTRASFVASLLKNTYDTPGLTPFHYSRTNHQGLEGGYVSIVSTTGASAGATSEAPGTDGGGAVYTTLGTKGAPVTHVTKLSSSVPSWLE